MGAGRFAFDMNQTCSCRSSELFELVHLIFAAHQK